MIHTWHEVPFPNNNAMLTGTSTSETLSLNCIDKTNSCTRIGHQIATRTIHTVYDRHITGFTSRSLKSMTTFEMNTHLAQAED